MKKFLLSLCMVLALAACDEKKTSEQANAKPVIKIGAILPLSGSQAPTSEAAKAGMLKALKEKTNPNQHYDYQLVFEDNQAKLASMPVIASKMIMHDNVDAIGTVTSAMAKVIAPISDQKGKILYAQSTEEIDYKPFGKYAFVQGFSSIALVEKVIEALKKQNADNIAIFGQNIGIQTSIVKDFERRLAEENIKYTINLSNPGETDFRMTIAQIRNKDFTKFSTMLFPPEKDIVIKQLIESGVERKDIIGMNLDMGKPKDLYNDTLSVSFDSGTEDFVESIQKEYELDCTHSAAEFYDFVSLIIEAYENLYKEGQKPTAGEVTAYIHNKKEFPCMSGICTVHANGFITNEPIFLTYKNNKWVKVEE